MKLIPTRTDHPGADPLPAEVRRLLHVLEQDWRQMTALAGNRRDAVPDRFDPARLDAVLPSSFVVQRTAPGSLRLRVAGQRLHDLLRMDPRGMPLTVFFQDAAKDTAARLAEMVMDGPAIVGLPLVSRAPLLGRALRGEMLLLPMRDAEGRITRAIGAVVTATDPAPGRSLRFTLDPARAPRCDLQHMDRAERRGPRAARAGKPAPKLRLVVNND